MEVDCFPISSLNVNCKDCEVRPLPRLFISFYHIQFSFLSGREKERERERESDKERERERESRKREIERREASLYTIGVFPPLCGSVKNVLWKKVFDIMLIKISL